MTSNYKIITLLLFSFLLESCGNYSFTGASIPEGTESFQVNFFENEAGNSMGSIFEPGLDRDFTIALQNILQNQTNLQLLSSDADLIYEGEIKEYRVSPMTSTSNLQASQNRLSVGVNVRFINIKKEEDNFERKFSFYFDYPAETQLLNVKSEAHDIIFERITQDIFNASLAKW
ncbi:MAG: LptE family protein [Flavobacteriaceae bacterium]|nr:LPS assembly lipoprotein LptE [Flavobacteriaceae bacterium]MDC3221339.1 LPS assembly lipoprotein LptE [Flavobacteriaceae bacterium]MDG1343711.1 LptE family protein [Flavobacteriaceae bacterium]MDG1792644.1 LptE family protein [Flavobacteriaceae bacterium]|tara:strand:+ start:170 stop:691 length:522 start_codon:yes stop_codon:yes gene_type:complete